MDSPPPLQGFLEYVIGQLVGHPGDVQITCEAGEDRQILHLKVNPQDMGRVIGKNGYTISSIRSLLDAAAAKAGTRVSLRIDEEDAHRESRRPPGRDRGHGRGGHRGGRGRRH